MSLLYEMIGRLTVFLVRFRMARYRPPQGLTLGLLAGIVVLVAGVVTALTAGRATEGEEPDSQA